MSYTAGEALILTRIQTLSAYGSTNSSRANWKILNRGTSATHVVLRPGSLESVFHGMGGNRQSTWTTNIEVWQRYGVDSTVVSSLMDNAQNIRNAIDQVPQLGDGNNRIVDAAIVSHDEPTEQWTNSGGPAWLKLTMVCRWTEQETISIS